MLQEELERDEKVGNRIWRGIGFEIFLLPGRVHASATLRERKLLARSLILEGFYEGSKIQ